METLENSEKTYDMFPKSTAEHSEINKAEILRQKKIVAEIAWKIAINQWGIPGKCAGTFLEGNVEIAKKKWGKFLERTQDNVKKGNGDSYKVLGMLLESTGNADCEG